MHNFYLDIRSRLKEEPTWYDCHGTPRYGKFNPILCPNIYAQEVLLLEISCQNCGKKFLVELNWDLILDSLINNNQESFSTKIGRWIQKLNGNYCPIHYGDPPNHCCTGDTMNCNDLKIIEFWKKEDNFHWKRITELEIKLEKE